METIRIIQCEECSSLGHSLQVSSAVLVTLSPDPLRGAYGDRTPASQKKWLIKQFNAGIKIIRNEYNLSGYAVHFELNKNMNLHIHALLWIDSKYAEYDLHCATISKIFHKLIGRSGVPSLVACDVQWVKDETQTMIYINKENVYLPIHGNVSDFCNTIKLIGA